MLKKKVLFVGDGNHFFVKNLAKELNDNFKNDLEVDILSLTNLNFENQNFYNNSYYKKADSLLSFFLKTKIFYSIYVFFRNKSILKEMDNYDYVHFHFLSPEKYLFVKYFDKIKKTKIIISIWGSDLYRLKKRNQKNFNKVCKKATMLTFANEQSRNFFIESQKIDISKTTICRFGLSPLDSILKIPLNKEECKKKLLWSENKIAIVIGYNLAPEQQHLKILKVFENNELQSLKDKILIILPITYGGTNVYKIKIVDKLKSLGFDYFVYDKLMNHDEIAILRKATDIMIQLQTTDQLSGSMSEHLFANNVVITGSWLPYNILKERKVWFLEIESFDELKKMLVKTINNISEFKVLANENHDKIYKLASWKENIKSWFKLYE